jgi:hypothetical protein
MDKTAFFNEAGLEQHLFILQEWPSRNRHLPMTQRGPAEEAVLLSARLTRSWLHF